MIKVRNKKAIANVARKSMKENRSRNIVAIIAIMLTALLFTSLFTLFGTLSNSFQEQTFRQVGGDFHGTFKNLTSEQVEILRQDPLIVKSGARLMLGMPLDPPFNKAHVEVSYMEKDYAEGGFSLPEEGTLPEENTNQIACDTRILKLLGVEPKLGATIELPYYMGLNDGAPLITDTFTLSGWWEYDEASNASMAIVPLSYAQEKLKNYSVEDIEIGTWDLSVYFKSSAHIEKDMSQVLINCGYEPYDNNSENYIPTGVNWAYIGAQLMANVDAPTIIAIAAILILIILTGYLIIYNIFQISVSRDIKFYGLLKVIGTTASQLRSILFRQALLLSAVGIPIGLVLGFACGNMLAPVIMNTLSYNKVAISINPWIFVIAAAFSLATVLLSCLKPARIAGKVSPIEAVRYTENSNNRKMQKRKTAKNNGLFHMAAANLGRSRRKAVLVVISLSLAVVLFQSTCVFSNGFDMDKYLNRWVVSDFILGSASYFQTNGQSFSEEQALSEDIVNSVMSMDGIKEGGCVYGNTCSTMEYVTEEHYKEWYGRWNSQEDLERILATERRNEEGKVPMGVQMYGMDGFALDQLSVFEGDLSAVYDPTQDAIAAVYHTDDYGKVEPESQWAKPGDKVTLEYVVSWKYIDSKTGEAIDNIDTTDIPWEQIRSVPERSTQRTYTVAACVTMKNSMSYRYSMGDEFVLNSQLHKRDAGSASQIMNCLFDTTDESNAQMESYLKNYTENEEPLLDYESKRSYEKEFYTFKNMFVLVGAVLSAIVAFVGVLNFFNAVLTSILTRRHEFAMLQAIGMSGKQLKGMLICEGEIYAFLAIGASFILSLIAGPCLDNAMNSMFWFFTYHFQIKPILIMAPIFLVLGAVLPIITYHLFAKQTIVERLHKAE